ncbi:CsbD family protein [Pontibacter oryzae]|nr:YtxH domain-containing protein [Pontibacter oryzae]
MNEMDKNSSKILLATLGGIGAGVVAGLLLAPKNGRDAREEVMRHLNKASDEVNSNVKKWTASLKARTGKGSPEEEQLVMHGSWDDVKRQLRKNYADLTEEDLSYKQGKESELFERLQTKLGKTKDEVVRMISEFNISK